MNPKITTAVVIAFLLYALYSWMSIPTYDGFDINSQTYETVLPVERPIVPPPKIIAPGGPSTPSEQPPSETIVVSPETPFDPQEQTYESAEHPDRLRHPERVYGPGLEQDNSTNAVESGIASHSFQKTMSAYQTFGPEFAQNGGAFMENGVVANDTSLNIEYSSV
jgi:hypothetical protein